MKTEFNMELVKKLSDAHPDNAVARLNLDSCRNMLAAGIPEGKVMSDVYDINGKKAQTFMNEAYARLPEDMKDSLSKQVYDGLVRTLRLPKHEAESKSMLEVIIRRILEGAIETMAPELLTHCHKLIQARWEECVERVVREQLDRAIVKVRESMSK